MEKKIVYFNDNPELKGMARTNLDIVYSEKAGQRLHLIRPWETENDARRYPLIVFVQGSGWTTPDLGAELPQLSQLARKGYVVATVCHRDCKDGHPVPAFLVDVKSAIRYLRAHAEEYYIDPERVAIWGTSSGGNTAVLCGITGDMECYKADKYAEYAEYSDAVKCVVECFGPTDMFSMLDPAAEPDEGIEFLSNCLAGDRDREEAMTEMSPLRRLQEGVQYPPMLLLHGDADGLVPYSQCEMMYDRMLELEQDVQCVCVRGADHEANFWSQELLDYIFNYIEERI